MKGVLDFGMTTTVDPFPDLRAGYETAVRAVQECRDRMADFCDCCCLGVPDSVIGDDRLCSSCRALLYPDTDEHGMPVRSPDYDRLRRMVTRSVYIGYRYALSRNPGRLKQEKD